MSVTTSALWSAAHSALCDREWAQARALLERLSARADVRDMLPSAASYDVPPGMSAVLQARIDAVNAVASR